MTIIRVVLILTLTVSTASGKTWRGLVVAPENHCSPYDSKDYTYSRSLEPKIVASIGKVYGPYSGRCFTNTRKTDIEHIVARSEAHDSGLCSAGDQTKRRFARDLLNLTLASPHVNRRLKRAHDAAEWMPDMNQCWFAARIVDVRLKYGLTIDQSEADVLERVLSKCDSTEMVVGDCNAERSTSTRADLVTTKVRAQRTPLDALALWDDNGNGRITCAEAQRHGIAPVRRRPPSLSLHARRRRRWSSL